MDINLICADGHSGLSAIEADMAPTMQAHAAKRQPMVFRANSGVTGSDRTVPRCDGTSNTIDTTNTQAIMYAQNQRYEIRETDVSGALQAERSSKQMEFVQTDVLRRLTPRECERLQGFADDWTRIPWRGKPADQCPDAPRYRCIGNSMAVPVVRWIGERLLMVDEMMGVTDED